MRRALAATALAAALLAVAPVAEAAPKPCPAGKATVRMLGK